jgi:hypothetical protein
MWLAHVELFPFPSAAAAFGPRWSGLPAATVVVHATPDTSQLQLMLQPCVYDACR